MLVILFISVFEYIYFCFKSVFEYLPHSLSWPYFNIYINWSLYKFLVKTCKELKVATSSPEERRSRHQSDVTTSVIREEGRDNT